MLLFVEEGNVFPALSISTAVRIDSSEGTIHHLLDRFNVSLDLSCRSSYRNDVKDNKVTSASAAAIQLLPAVCVCMCV